MGQILTYLYPISYFVSLVGLISWFYFQENRSYGRLMSTVFLGGFAVYAVALAFADGALGYKLGILFRDLIVIGLVSQFFNFFRKNKLVFGLMMAVLFGAFSFKGYDILQNTFPQLSNTNVQLDQNAELLVEIKEAHQITELQTLTEKYDLTYQRAFYPGSAELTLLDNYFTVDVPQDKTDQLAAIQEDLQASGLIDWVEENEMIFVDPFESTSPLKQKRNFGINDPGLEYLWGFDVMEMDQLYHLLNSLKIKPAKKARIVILDTGIDAQHEDLKDNYKSIHKKYDSDVNKHGTHCAGIAAAVTNNKLGIASFSTDNSFVEVSAIKVLSDGGSGTQAGIINGIIEAADNGADVISLSLGGFSSKSRQRAYNKAVKYANDQNAIVVVAAGNSNRDASTYAPANTKGVITVTAINPNMDRADFSNFINKLDRGIAAPGVAIYSTIPGNQYDQFSGTSMATPQVAGLLGLMKSIQPDLDTDKAYKIISTTGKATNAVKETGFLIQPAAAIEALVSE